MSKTSFLAVMVAMSIPAVAQGSSVAPMREPRCSQTSLATMRRMVEHEESRGALIADALHLLPHLEGGIAPIDRRIVIAAKPSVTTCLLELHLAAEVGIGFARSGESEEGKKYVWPETLGDATWRLGVEGFIRPSRWFPEQWRLLDAFAVGFGMLGGDVFSVDRELLEEEMEMEIGPRVLFDVNEWLTFVVAVNGGFRPSMHLNREPMTLSAIGSVQLSFPGHLVFGNTHTTH
jgi:hypothetical protein